MFFEEELLTFRILDVLEFRQEHVSTKNRGRNFNALSYRFRSDARLQTRENEYIMTDRSVAYIPARLDYSRCAATDELIVIHFDTADYQTQSIETFVAAEDSALADLFRKILDCWNKKELGYRYRCSAILYEIFAACYAQNFTPRTKDSKIQNSVTYLLAHYKEHDLSVREIAAQSFMSEVYFRKLFKKAYGISPQRYIMNLRIQNAAGLISSGYYSLKEVAYLSGYTDYKYFSVSFKKRKGVSPSEYLYNFHQ